MAKGFYERLAIYFRDIAKTLESQAKSSAIFPNSSDVGGTREVTYKSFIEMHAPTRCNVFLGGFLFSKNGNESKQMDIIITNDTTPRYDLHNGDGMGKSFGPVDGCLGVVSVKSKLDKKQLFDALKGFASIPENALLSPNQVNPMIKFRRYEEWPYKILYASDGISYETMLKHLTDFYTENSNISRNRRPDIIHVIGQYMILKIKKDILVNDFSSGEKIELNEGTYQAFTEDSDVQAMIWVLNELQNKAKAAAHINFNYDYIQEGILPFLRIKNYQK